MNYSIPPCQIVKSHKLMNVGRTPENNEESYDRRIREEV